jgi:sialic acid synthase SpsE
MPEIFIDGRAVGPDHPPYVIAEAGLNHNGELEKALEMIRVAKIAGADAIKFQTFKAEEFVGDPIQTYTYRSQGKDVTEPMLDMFRRYELPRQAWFEIKTECQRQGITFLSTPQNRSDLDLLLEVGVPAVKIGSDDFTNLPLLKSYAETGLPLILSCGMSDLAEVYQALETVGALDGYPTILLLCTSQYPTPPEDANLLKLRTLQAAFPMVVAGFSDHTQGPLASSLAVALGACLFEKHFTLDHDLPGPDHWFAENSGELAEWVSDIRKAYVMLGGAVVRPTSAEREMRLIARRSVVALQAIGEGEAITGAVVGLRRPGGGIAPAQLANVLGRKARRVIPAGKLIDWADLL